MKSLEIFFALRYLKSKRREVFISIITIISVLGVAVSIVVLNMVMAIMSGFEREIRSKLIDTDAHARIVKTREGFSNYQKVIDKLSSIEEIESIYPYTQTQALMSVGSYSSGLIVRGLPLEESALTRLNKFVDDVSLNNKTVSEQISNKVVLKQNNPLTGDVQETKLPPLIIGKALREKLGLISATPVSIFSSELTNTPSGIVPKARRFMINGSYHSGLYEYENNLAYTNIKFAQEFFSLGDQVSGLEIWFKDSEMAPILRDKILLKLLELDNGFRYVDWSTQNRSFFEAIKLEKRVYFLVLLLLILVASFSIVSTMIMVVMEKSKDIAVLKTIGVSNKSIIKIFFNQSLIIGITGVLIGTVLGYLGCYALKTFGFPIDVKVFSMDTVPVYINYLNFILVAFAGILITSISGLYPAFRASRLNPAEVLRFE